MLKIIREFRKKRTRLKWFCLIPRACYIPYCIFIVAIISIASFCGFFFFNAFSYSLFKDFSRTFDYYYFLSKEHIANSFAISLKFFLLEVFFVIAVITGDYGIGINFKGIYTAGTRGMLCKTDILIFTWGNFKNIRVGNPDLLFRNVRRVFFYFDKSKARNVDFFTRYLYGKVGISVEEKDLPELLSEIKKYAPERLHPPEVSSLLQSK